MNQQERERFDDAQGETEKLVEEAREHVGRSRGFVSENFSASDPDVGELKDCHLEPSNRYVLDLAQALSASLAREREMRDALETIERGSAKPEPALPSRLVSINSIARRGLKMGTTDEYRGD